jgi:hypothetical protein
MKAKLSVTLDAPLVRFLDSLPGQSRSAKLQTVLRAHQRVAAEARLRRELARAREADAGTAEREAWRRTMEADQWRE